MNAMYMFLSYKKNSPNPHVPVYHVWTHSGSFASGETSDPPYLVTTQPFEKPKLFFLRFFFLTKIMSGRSKKRNFWSTDTEKMSFTHHPQGKQQMGVGR